MVDTTDNNQTPNSDKTSYQGYRDGSGQQASGNSQPLPDFLRHDYDDRSTSTTTAALSGMPDPSTIEDQSGGNNTGPFPDANFAWVQEYMAKSNQYFFFLNKFTIFGLSGALFLLGTLFFSSGFLTAFWLLAYTDVLHGGNAFSDESSSNEVKYALGQITKLEKEGLISSTDPGIKKLQATLEDELNTPIWRVKNLLSNFDQQKKYKTVVLFASTLPSHAIKSAKDLEQRGYNVYVVKHPPTTDQSTSYPPSSANNTKTHYRVQLGAYKSTKFAKDVFNFMSSQLDSRSISMHDGILQNRNEEIIYPR